MLGGKKKIIAEYVHTFGHDLQVPQHLLFFIGGRGGDETSSPSSMATATGVPALLFGFGTEQVTSWSPSGQNSRIRYHWRSAMKTSTG